MHLVVDTNVVVSALLKPGSVPARALDASIERATILFDARVVDEYRRVLARPKLRLDPAASEALVARLVARGRDVGDCPRWAGEMRDEDDRLFVEVALAGRADVLVTGNIADFPFDAGFEVLPPATLLARLGY